MNPTTTPQVIPHPSQHMYEHRQSQDRLFLCDHASPQFVVHPNHTTENMPVAQNFLTIYIHFTPTLYQQRPIP